MITTLLLGVGGLVLLYFGGEALVRGASALARRLGLSPLAVGLTVVAFGTSAPELIVSLQAALTGASDIAVGNVVGSNIANVALILGVAALIRPIAVETKIIRLDAPLMVLVSLILLGVVADGEASRVEGALLLAGLVAYTGFTLRQAKREPEPLREGLSSVPAGSPSLALSVGMVIAGLALLVVGGRLLLSSAVTIATAWGISQAAIGLTIVAVGTSLPELATSLIAAARGEGDIATGNVIGSNLFNVLGVLGMTALVEPLARGGVTWIDLGVMLALAVALLPMLVTRRRLDRLEGALLVAGFVAYTVWLLAL